ncbi:hypothetical protein [uncultured Aquimarina sp.]|uniref:hypothetical protein n=1 Tax=uncultured Aquimarina sp. TaxID=575652 RepID=UPI00262A5F00|nr:hypothetical protein [uncultured Aquimarina sp.]
MKKVRQTIIVWIAIYPTITIIQYFFENLLNTFRLEIRTLILTVVLVPLMVYVLVPFWTKILTKTKKNSS